MAQSYPIRDVACRHGLTLRTLRFYEDKGILQPQRQGKVRLYSDRDEAILRLVLRGKALGLSLEEIGAGLGADLNGDPVLRVPRETLVRHREAAERARRALKERVRQWDAFLATAEGPMLTLKAP